MSRSNWPTVAELRQALQGSASPSRAEGLDHLHWLSVYGLVPELESLVASLRSSPHWDAPLALEVSLAWVLAGQPHQSDLAFLEADAIAPSLALVPDVWGLWPAPAGDQPAEISALAARIRHWRHLDPTALDAAWRQRAQADWTYALTSPGREELILLLRHEAALPSPIEPFLAELVGEEQIAASPAEALPFWGLLTDLRPDWVHARLKAADLALALGEQQRCATWITTATSDVKRNPWYSDIAARAALDSGAVAVALDHWGQALAEAPPELAEVFRQRRREARRGPGLLQARSLLERGDAMAALALLQRLVADDPQWQPLRALLQQAETAAVAHRGEAVAAPAAQRFGQFLERAAGRIGFALPPATPAPEGVTQDPQALRQQLSAFSRGLTEAEARFALGA